MIAQINSGCSFGGLVGYANDIARKDTVIVASQGVCITSNATIVASFKAQAKMRPSLKNFVGHISISFSPLDTPRLTNEFMAEVAREYLRRRGIMNTQFVMFRHHDQPHGHLHIVYNRVDNDGHAIKGDNNYRASAAVTKALTREYGLHFGKGKKDVRRSRLKGKDAIKYRLYDNISIALNHCRNWQSLRTALSAKGITVNLVQGYNGRIVGVSFTDDSHKVTFAGSKIDRSLSLAGLVKALGMPDGQEHQSSLSSDNGETRTGNIFHDGHRHGTDVSAECQTGQMDSPSPNSDGTATGSDGDGSSSGGNIAAAVAEILMQPAVAPTSEGGGGGGNDRGWNDDDKERKSNRNKRRRR